MTKNILCIPSGVVICNATQARGIRATGTVLAEGIIYPNEREAAIFGEQKYVEIAQRFVGDEFTVY